MTSKRILFVDDDPKVLSGVVRQFDEAFDISTATSPDEALSMFDGVESFAVVVSDMRMPEMTGVELLSRVRQKSPDTVRIMLTGFADLASTIEAVNEGHIFRFLSKPCSPEILENAIRAGLKQYQLVHSEKELLEGTLHGSIKVLSEVLSLVNPLAFGWTSQVQRISLSIAEQLELEDVWDLKIACLLFPLGFITVSETALECVMSGRVVPDSEKEQFQHHAEVAANMLRNIPRLQGVSEIVALQDLGFDGSNHQCKIPIRGAQIPIGARILKVASDFAIACKRTDDADQAVDLLKSYHLQYDPMVIEALESAIAMGLCRTSSKSVMISGIAPGMVLARDIRGANGQLIITKGQSISESNQRRLEILAGNKMIGESIQVETIAEAYEPVLV